MVGSTTRREKPPPIMPVFWVGKAQRPYILLAPVDLGPVGAQARNEPDRLQASSKIENSVVTTGSNISVMQFTIDLNVKKMHQPELKCCKHVSGHRRKRPTNVEHRCEKAVAHGPHKV